MNFVLSLLFGSFFLQTVIVIVIVSLLVLGTRAAAETLASGFVFVLLPVRAEEVLMFCFDCLLTTV